MPVHPCGNYFYNCLKSILEYKHSYHDLRVVHRLDKQTSGIVFFAKNVPSANEFAEDLRKTVEIKKCYFARVKGKVENQERFTVDKPI